MIRSPRGHGSIVSTLAIGALLALASKARAEPVPSTSGADRTGRPTAASGEEAGETAGEAGRESPAPPTTAAPTGREQPAEARTEAPDSAPPPAPSPSAVPPASAATSAPSPRPAPTAPAEPGATARVEVHVARAGCWLELRSSPGVGEWIRACELPCSTTLVVDGREARVAGAGVTPSNPFLIEPGPGTARLEARPGSARARRYGTVALASGVPLVLAGITGHAFGQLEDSPALRDGGVAVAALGTAAIAAALPLLAAGATRVRDGRGRRIAATPTLPAGL